MRKLGKFFDNKHFARGFNRSGDFTINEAQILENYGKTMQGLYEGRLTPEDDDEYIFITDLKREGEGSSNKFTSCWKKYLSKTQRKRSYTLCSTVKGSHTTYADDEDSSNDFLIED